MPRTTTKTNLRPRRSPGTRSKTAAKRTRPARKVEGIPLKRTTIWVYDTDSPQFKAARERELREIKRHSAERDGTEFIESALADPESLKWWQ